MIWLDGMLRLRPGAPNVITIPNIKNPITDAYDNGLSLTYTLREWSAAETPAAIENGSCAASSIDSAGSYRGTIPETAAIRHGTNCYLDVDDPIAKYHERIECVVLN